MTEEMRSNPMLVARGTAAAAGDTADGGSHRGSGSKLINLLVCTWNVGNKKPDSSLAPWIPEAGAGYDVIVVGVQESKYGKKSKKAKAGVAAPSEGAGAMPVDVVPAEQTTAANTAEIHAAPPLVVESESLEDEEDVHAEDDSDEEDMLLSAAPDERGVEEERRAEERAGERGGEERVGEESAAKRPTSAGAGGSGWLSGLRATGLSKFVKNSTAEGAGQSAAIFEHIKGYLGDTWMEVRSIMMWQTGIIVLARKSVASAIDASAVGTEATGILGVGQNKGGTAAVVRMHGTTMCFVNTHLAAHMKHVEARNANCAEIINNIRLGLREDGTSTGPLIDSVDMDVLNQHCFWFGDMNYRIDLAIAEGGERSVDSLERRKQVQELIERKEFARLAAADQLNDAIKSGKVLHGFKESDVAFPPTFKMERQLGFVYKNQRVPSWCDRVLWKSQPALADDLKCTSYSAHPEVKSSDHKPVSAGFALRCRPLPLIAVPTLGPAKLKLSGVTGQNLLGMDVTGLSDVYLLFFTVPDVLVTGKAIPRSKTKSQTINPTWADADIPELALNISSADNAAHAHLLIVVMDYDAIDADDRMGQCIIPLRAALENAAPHPFTVPVTKSGKQHGVLSGHIQITFPSAHVSHAEVATTSNKSCCTGCVVQ